MVLRFWHVKRELLSHRLSKAKALGLWIPRPLSYPLTLQFGVLLGRQVQEHSAPSSHNGLIQHQPTLLVRDPAATLYELDHIVGRCEAQLPGQGSPQILLEELALPAVAVLEVHVRLMKTLPKADMNEAAAAADASACR